MNQPAASDWRFNEPVLSKIIVAQRSENSILRGRGEVAREGAAEVRLDTRPVDRLTDAMSFEHTRVR